LLAPEGVNATIGATPDSLDTVLEFLEARLQIRRGELKFSHAAKKPFRRFKVRPKKEIITLRKPEADPNVLAGDYVAPENWNALISDPDVTVIDTRNRYETEVGIFKNALDPKLRTFSEFPKWVEENLDPGKHKKIAMFCTGGIRCEKASAYMRGTGFENVYHLKGGILKYLEIVSSDRSLWEGECFVFDRRVAVGHALEQGSFDICHGCREPLSPQDREDPVYEEGVACPHCAGTLSPERARNLRMRHRDYRRNQGGAL